MDETLDCWGLATSYDVSCDDAAFGVRQTVLVNSVATDVEYVGKYVVRADIPIPTREEMDDDGEYDRLIANSIAKA